MARYSTRRADGYVIITDPDGPITEGETLQCVHCQAHWIIQPGSGIERGWCFKCFGPLCGEGDCMSHCAPWEKQLEIAEERQRLFTQVERMTA